MKTHKNILLAGLCLFSISSLLAQTDKSTSDIDNGGKAKAQAVTSSSQPVIQDNRSSSDIAGTKPGKASTIIVAGEMHSTTGEKIANEEKVNTIVVQQERVSAHPYKPATGKEASSKATKSQPRHEGPTQVVKATGKEAARQRTINPQPRHAGPTQVVKPSGAEAERAKVKRTSSVK